MSLDISNNNGGLPIASNGNYCPLIVAFPPPSLQGPNFMQSQQCGVISYNITANTGVSAATVTFQALGINNVWANLASPSALSWSAPGIKNGSFSGPIQGVRIVVSGLTGGTLSAQLSSTVTGGGGTGSGGGGGGGGTATIAVGTVTDLPNGTPPTVVNSGTALNAVFDFGLERGANGSAGAAATIAVGSVTDLPNGTPPTVVNAGTSAAAILNFGLERGADGQTIVGQRGSVFQGTFANSGSLPAINGVTVIAQDFAYVGANLEIWIAGTTVWADSGFQVSNATAIVNVYAGSQSGTWTKGANVTQVTVAGVGGGASGGSGAVASSTSSGAGGGGGGGGGARNTQVFRASDLPSTVPYVVGAGGASVAGVTVAGTGNAGNAGASTTFGTGTPAAFLTCKGGFAGAAGTIAGGGAGGANARGNVGGGAGGATSITVTAAAGAAGGGAGGGGGLTVANVFLAGGNGGAPDGAFDPYAAATGGATSGANGAAGESVTTNCAFQGGGGAGGAGSPTTNGGAGGAGGIYGGGGGGGGASGTTTHTSGASGAGADGILIVMQM